MDFRYYETSGGSSSGRFWGKDTIWDSGCRYMIRRWIGPLRIHTFLRGDGARDPHNHPFWFVTFPLRSYVEEVTIHRNGEMWKQWSRVVRAFIPHFRPSSHTHRVLGAYRRRRMRNGNVLAKVKNDVTFGRKGKPIFYDFKGTVVTLILFGRAKKAWGFWKRDRNRRICFIPHKLYSEKKDQPCG